MKTSSGLIIPSVDKGAPEFTCLVCGSKFAKQDKRKYVNHTVTCSKQIDSEIHDYIEARDSNVFSGLADPEAQDWIQKRLAEGKPGARNGRPT